uniref:Kinesin motor domain-containing protein n=1 Tax=Kalanchoe fedtschenkoi TaxID=63787 RepID=A0A7N0RFL2_KALFE
MATSSGARGARHLSVATSARNGAAQMSQSVRSKGSLRRSVTPISRSVPNGRDEGGDAGRVRVAVRLRPRNVEEIQSDADYADCVELEPELKRLKIRKNNWSSESYKFDEVFTETASQRRVYEVVAKPVVESVLSGYNGTVMAYGQTGTGKTYTVGRLGKEDASERGIMVRALEDIIAGTSTSSSDCVEVSYVQLYMESVQDLLAPETTNIPIVEDPKTGEVSLPGAAIIKIRDIDHFSNLLRTGEANRHAANTKLNTESSRSHAILMVYVRRIKGASDEAISGEDAIESGDAVPTVRKSKLLIVDLAGSERVNKSGSEGHSLEEAKFINLSLTSLGKCINALAENSPHIPVRDSKLTRLLRDSFGGSARTSLIVTIGPSACHHAETTSTIMFGQRAMRIVNMLKLKEEFDYESLCRKLQTQIDHLTAEMERQQKSGDCEKEEFARKLRESENLFSEAKRELLIRSEFLEKQSTRLEMEKKEIMQELNHQKTHNTMMCDRIADLEMGLARSKHLENSLYQKGLADTTQMYEKKIGELMRQLEDERACSETAKDQIHFLKQLLSDKEKSIQQYQMDTSAYRRELAETVDTYEKKITEMKKQLDEEHAACKILDEQLEILKERLLDYQNKVQGQETYGTNLLEMTKLQETTLNELQSLKSEFNNLFLEKKFLEKELHDAKQNLAVEVKQRKFIENDLLKLKKSAPDVDDDVVDKKLDTYEDRDRSTEPLEKKASLHKPSQSRGSVFGQRATIAKICEEVGLEKILGLLASEDLDVQIHAVKVVANLAAEDGNQQRIVEEGGLDALLKLLQSSDSTAILRVASGAIANLAMNEMNQDLIVSKSGGRLLAKTASKTKDLQTLRMVAGAIANLCGNERLHKILQEDGGIRALLHMAESGNVDVIAQVARGLANFAKCETKGTIHGLRKGPSLLLEEGTLSWLIANSNIAASSTRRHIELAICHLAQNEANARDLIFSGGLKELQRISIESSRDDIRNLATKTLAKNSSLRAGKS